jgi:uncharacterized protein YaaN involved in tellurite resistance
MNETPLTPGLAPPAAASASGFSLDLTADPPPAPMPAPAPQAIATQDAPPDEALVAKARAMARELTMAPDPARQDMAKAAVEDMGRSLQTESARRSAMLQQPLRTLAKNGEDGGPVANALMDLRERVESLDPSRFDFSPGWMGRVLSAVPGIGSPIRRYFAQFESAQTAIDAVVASLERGRDQLKRDNITLAEDQRAMRELTQRLERQAQLGELLDGQIQYHLDREIPAEDPRRAFVEQDLLFPLRQRIIDLQTQLAVNRQGVLAIGIILQNNQELIRGVNRALDTTLSALHVAVVVAMALTNQRLVLDQVSALSQTTTSLIADTGKRLRTQGTEIHRQAAAATLDIAALRSAFADVTAAMDDIARYRREALPQMAKTILEFDALAKDAERRIVQADEAQQAAPRLSLDLDASS